MLPRSKALSRIVVAAVAVPALALVPLAALGAPKAAKPAAAYDPDNVVAIRRYMETIAKGNERFIAKEHAAAIDAYKKAIQLSPREPLAYLLLTEAYLVTGNMGEAEAAIQQAYEADAKDATLRGHVLLVRADVFERQKKWEQAKLAWQAFVEHASKLDADAGAHPQTGVERLKAIEKVLDRDKAYASVRDRIAAEKAAVGKPAPKK